MICIHSLHFVLSIERAWIELTEKEKERKDTTENIYFKHIKGKFLFQSYQFLRMDDYDLTKRVVLAQQKGGQHFFHT